MNNVFADMKTKKTPKFKQKVLSEAEEAEQKGVGQGGGKLQPLGRAPPSGGTPKDGAECQLPQSLWGCWEDTPVIISTIPFRHWPQLQSSL